MRRFLFEVAIWAVPTIFAIILHEIMHGVAALALGDDTARRARRLTLNPLRHIDLFGTIIMPAILLFIHAPVFGYAKPVPVNFRRLQPRRLGMILVAAAGPLTNLTLAVLSGWARRMVMPYAIANGPGGAMIADMLTVSVLINIVLAVFNLFPLLPLDGGRVLVGLLPITPARLLVRLEPYGFLILLLLLYTNVVDAVINPVINAIARMLL